MAIYKVADNKFELRSFDAFTTEMCLERIRFA